MNRRSFLASALALTATGARGASGPAAVQATDIAGRSILLAAPARRIVLGEARHIAVLGMLHDDPVALVAGWRQDKSLDTASQSAWRARFPAMDAIAPVGAGNRALSAESVLALAPDLVVLSLVDRDAPQMALALDQLGQAGVPVAFVDFFSKPMENTLPSLRILAALTGGAERAEAFAAFYRSRLNRITQRLTGAPRPRAFVQVHAAAADCCNTVGRALFDDFITAAGGVNLGRDMVPGAMGNVGLENLLAADPDVFLASGGAHLAARGGLVLGPGIGADAARDSLCALTSAPGFADLRAVQQGRTLGFWHLFNDSPAHIALIEALAQVLHPRLFADLDPDATMRDFAAQFSPVPVAGQWWVRA